MNLRNLLGILIGQENKDYSTWHQIGKLTPEETLAKRGIEAKALGKGRELKLLETKAKAIQAEMEVAEEEWWQMLYKGHALPEKRNYHLTDDGRILVEPEGKDEAGKCIWCAGKGCECSCHEDKKS